jgi:hypothetical protein
MPTPKKPNLPFLDDDEQETPDEQQLDSHDDDTREHAPLKIDHGPGLSDTDDEATVAVPPIKPASPSIPRPNRR